MMSCWQQGFHRLERNARYSQCFLFLYFWGFFCLQKSIPRHFCCSLSHWIISALFKATFRVRKQKRQKKPKTKRIPSSAYLTISITSRRVSLHVLGFFFIIPIKHFYRTTNPLNRCTKKKQHRQHIHTL